MPTLKVIHIAKSLKSQPYEPKLVKEYVCPTFLILTVIIHSVRLKRTYQTKLTTEDLYRNIRKNMSPEPGFSGNDFTYFSELNNALETTESLWYNIPFEHKVNIKSKSIFYWPTAEVTFEPDNSGTTVTVKFVGTVLAFAVYGILGYLANQNPSELPQILPALVFIVPLALIPVFFRRIQNNIISQLQYS
ncbi:MAG: hypothetical protein ACJARP_003253 [Vicingaceae bacterium]|jgi:hypothetical protein